MQVIEGRMSKGGGRHAIVVAKFNQSITERLLEGAVETLRKHGIADDAIVVVRVPGAFEIPMVAARLAAQADIDCVLCLGAVIRGETSHDEHINRAISLQFAELGVKYQKPIIFGVLTCNTVEQAIARSGGGENVKDKAIGGKVSNKGSEAAEAALEMLDLLRQLS